MTMNRQVPDEKKSILIAYLMWGLGFVGIGGMHRFYLGQNKAGIALLLSLGGFGIGQLLDVSTLSDSVKVANGEKAPTEDKIKKNSVEKENARASKPVKAGGSASQPEAGDTDEFDQLLADQAELEKRLKSFRQKD